MQFDFMDGTGRFDETGAELYSDNDLAFGHQYAIDYLAHGITEEPMMHFDLQAFADWCKGSLHRPTEKQFDVLWQLSDDDFLKPMDFGAWDGSHHSNTARHLATKGLVEISGYQSFSRRVNKYRRTPAGKAAFEQEKARRNV